MWNKSNTKPMRRRRGGSTPPSTARKVLVQALRFEDGDGFIEMSKKVNRDAAR
jgi:hypothetical protein